MEYSAYVGLSFLSLSCRATKFFELFTPLVCDITLLFKVLSFYPPTLYPTTIRRIGPVIPLIILALLRAASCSLGVATVALSQSSDREYLDSYDYTIFDMIEYGLQVIFCIYSSILLFRKLFKIANHRRLGHTSLPRKRKVRILIEATAMTFIFPILAQIGAVVSAATGQGVFYCYFAYSNIYLSVICSVLATSWSTIRNTRDTGSPPANNSSIGHHPLFSRARWLRRRPCRDGRGTKTGQVEEDSKSTTSSEREARQIDTVGRMEAGDEVDPMTSIRAIAPHDTLLSSIFDEALPADDVGITSSRAQSEAMEMLASSVHGHTHSSSSLDDAWLPQSIDRPSQVRRRASFRHSVVRRQ